MLGVEQHLVLDRGGVGDAVADHHQVLIERAAKRRPDMEVPGLADQAGDRGRGIEDGGKAGIVGRAVAGAPGHAESREARVLERRQLGEEGIVGGVGARPAALDVVEAQAVEGNRDRPLVGDGEIDALGLGAVAQRAVVEIDAIVGQGAKSPAGWARGGRHRGAPLGVSWGGV
jgi:hypothetical protein